MAEVIGIHGAATPDENGADPQVVTLLRDLCRDAESGALKAIAVASVYGNAAIHTRSAGSGFRHMLVAATVYLQGDLAGESGE